MSKPTDIPKLSVKIAHTTYHWFEVTWVDGQCQVRNENGDRDEDLEADLNEQYTFSTREEFEAAQDKIQASLDQSIYLDNLV